VLVTRRWPELVEGIARLAGEAIEIALIEAGPPDDPAALEAALSRLAVYEWIVFTSANAVDAVATGMAALGAVRPPTLRIAAVGPATARAIHGAWADAAITVEPSQDFRGTGLLEAFSAHEVAGRRMLLPVSDRAQHVVERGLLERGARIDRVIAYRTVTLPASELRDQLGRTIDAAVFASPSAVDAFRAAAGEAGASLGAVVIGPTTAEAARAAGLRVLATAFPADAEGMVRALVRALGRPEVSRRA